MYPKSEWHLLVYDPGAFKLVCIAAIRFGFLSSGFPPDPHFLSIHAAGGAGGLRVMDRPHLQRISAIITKSDLQIFWPPSKSQRVEKKATYSGHFRNLYLISASQHGKESVPNPIYAGVTRLLLMLVMKRGYGAGHNVLTGIVWIPSESGGSIVQSRSMRFVFVRGFVHSVFPSYFTPKKKP